MLLQVSIWYSKPSAELAKETVVLRRCTLNVVDVPMAHGRSKAIGNPCDWIRPHQRSAHVFPLLLQRQCSRKNSGVANRHGTSGG
jgi:hypothetical protein